MRLLPIAAIVVCACAATPGGRAKPASEVEAELLRVDREFCALAQRVSMSEACQTYLASDATAMPQASPFLQGRDAITKFWTGIPAARDSWVPQFARAAASGDLGYTYGTWTHESAEGTVRGKYVTIWRRQEDGTWKAVFDGGNTLVESSG